VKETIMNRALATTALLSAALLISSPAAAEPAGWTDYHPSRTLFSTGWQISQPLGSLHDYVGSTSFRGLTFDFRSMVVPDISVGLRFSWNRYNENQAQVQQQTSSGGTISGPVFHYADQFGLTAIGHYYFGDKRRDTTFVPYVGLGLGGAWNNSYQQTVDLGFSQNGFYFLAQPELGLNINLAKGQTTAALTLAVLYNYSTASFREVSNAQAITETFGFTFAY